MITIVTALKNGEKFINHLISSLNSQTNLEFKWLVIDSLSYDNSLEIIQKNCLINYKIIMNEDFSIYHALNIALKLVETEYYCVAGCDDVFDKNFVSNFYQIIKSENYDLILGKVNINNNIIIPISTPTLLNPTNASHSIGTIIKLNLHKKYGIYSNLYPVMADKYFISKILLEKNLKFIISDSLFGTYSVSGFSSINSYDHICDLYKIQIKLGYNSFLQTFILMTRLLKLNLKNIIR